MTYGEERRLNRSLVDAFTDAIMSRAGFDADGNRTAEPEPEPVEPEGYIHETWSHGSILIPRDPPRTTPEPPLVSSQVVRRSAFWSKLAVDLATWRLGERVRVTVAPAGMIKVKPGGPYFGLAESWPRWSWLCVLCADTNGRQLTPAEAADNGRDHLRSAHGITVPVTSGLPPRAAAAVRMAAENGIEVGRRGLEKLLAAEPHTPVEFDEHGYPKRMPTDTVAGDFVGPPSVWEHSVARVLGKPLVEVGPNPDGTWPDRPEADGPVFWNPYKIN